ncbi:MAG: hypothetical protein AVDCRST_MAG47-436, partial [uncultured Nocardioidaceae bacterium]
ESRGPRAARARAARRGGRPLREHRGVLRPGARVVDPVGLARRGAGGAGLGRRRDRPRRRAGRRQAPGGGGLGRGGVLRRGLPRQRLAVRHRLGRVRSRDRPEPAGAAVLPAAAGDLGAVVHGRLGRLAVPHPAARPV